MTDREKAINGLICHTLDYENHNCLDCPYYYPLIPRGCSRSLARDAFKLLEPRVLTLEEVKQLKSEDVVWLEDADTSRVTTGLVVYAGWLCIDFHTAQSVGVATGFYYNYDSVWRCWNQRPTEEERGAVPWVGSNQREE